MNNYEAPIVSVICAVMAALLALSSLARYRIGKNLDTDKNAGEEYAIDEAGDTKVSHAVDKHAARILLLVGILLLVLLLLFGLSGILVAFAAILSLALMGERLMSYQTNHARAM